MGAMRHPDRPSIPLEPRDRPHLSSPSTARPTKLGRLFLMGVSGAVIGAILLVIGAATASATLIWTAVALILLAALALK